MNTTKLQPIQIDLNKALTLSNEEMCLYSAEYIENNNDVSKKDIFEIIDIRERSFSINVDFSITQQQVHDSAENGFHFSAHYCN